MSAGGPYSFCAEDFMSHEHPKPTERKADRVEPDRTGGQAEGCDADVPENSEDRERIAGPRAAQREERDHAEPHRTPGQAEGSP
jgi:hypothetical protein